MGGELEKLCDLRKEYREFSTNLRYPKHLTFRLRKKRVSSDFFSPLFTEWHRQPPFTRDCLGMDSANTIPLAKSLTYEVADFPASPAKFS